MKSLLLLMFYLALVSCSTNQEVLNKSRSDLKSYLDTEYLKRPLHLPDNINTFDISYFKKSVTSDGIKIDTSRVVPSAKFVRNISENLQSLFGYLPFAYSYKVHDDNSFKTSIFFGLGFGYSTQHGGFILPNASILNKYIISDKHGITFGAALSTFNKYVYRYREAIDRKIATKPSIGISYIFQANKSTHLSVGIKYLKDFYETECEDCSHIDDLGWIRSIDKQNESWVLPLNLTITKRVLDETEVSIFSNYSKLGYENNYEDLRYGFNIEWYFPTDG